MQQIQQEEKAGRITPADWSRIVPPISGSATEVFHQKLENTCLKPNFFPQPIAWLQDSKSDLKTDFQSTQAQNSPPTGRCPFHKQSFQ